MYTQHESTADNSLYVATYVYGYSGNAMAIGTTSMRSELLFANTNIGGLQLG